MPDEQTLTQREGVSAAPSQAASGTGLELKSLTKRFGEDVAAVDDINLHIAHGEFVVLVGPSGCGKTTTLRMIAGFDDLDAGEILLDGGDQGLVLLVDGADAAEVVVVLGDVQQPLARDAAPAGDVLEERHDVLGPLRPAERHQ